MFLGLKSRLYQGLGCRGIPLGGRGRGEGEGGGGEGRGGEGVQDCIRGLGVEPLGVQGFRGLGL